ncbi:oligopeptide transporter protein [Cordyceps fumosorosea ARSEF 2679]|uniref:Oligopeptide transporter protein n=1 Tax=Cordyceps fumosorosea (strain ARSEF 2679) TaxID=1081104 RepID=A0A162JJ44_CORFA|nr:oligopeptide transporter protein [Cordyceps fumosorosea ARSEF 2679]OAA69782.1 oligopeptide transporter protein [Cordyceps fumosorosea ARSEF 2679]
MIPNQDISDAPRHAASDSSSVKPSPPQVVDEKTRDQAHHHQCTTTPEDGGVPRVPGAPMDDVEYVRDKIDAMTVDEARDILRALLAEHEYDYNFAQSLRDQMTALLAGPLGDKDEGDWAAELKTVAALNRFYSPYPEVRAVTTPDDDDPDGTMPCETPRAYLVGLSWAIVAQFTNTLFMSRFPSISLSSAVVQILLYPCGLLLAWALPDWGFVLPRWLGGGSRISLNPGPWSYKEQMLATIIMNVSVNAAFGFANIQTQTIFYHDDWLTAEYGILLLLSTQLLGLGLSGLLRRFVVYPVEAIWPALLPTVALNKALLMPERHRGETVHGWSLSRYRVFFIFFAGMFLYYWIPGYLFPALSSFAWMTWIAPNNFALNVMTGNSGIGFNPLPTLDWNVISQNGAPLAIPFFAYLQQASGQLIAAFVLIAIYWTNSSWTAHLPPNTPSIFDNRGAGYNITRVIDPRRAVVVEEKYRAYSPPFYTAGSLVMYGAFFLFYPLTMVFVLLDSWRPLLKAGRSMARAVKESVAGTVRGVAGMVGALARGDVRGAGRHLYGMFSSDGSIYDDFDDPLTNIMRKYPEVPDWWFLSIALIAFIFAIVIPLQYPQLETPVWTIFFVVALNLVFLIPMTYINAISGITQGLNVATELIMGYALPGHPEAMIFVKTYGWNINGQADNYISDQKMGFYAKIPPRAMYRGQILSTIITAFVCYGVVTFVDTTIPDICTPNQEAKFNCLAGSALIFASSVVWGAIGPARVFSQLYPAMKYCFLLGFLLALAWWTGKRFGPRLRQALHNTLPAAVFRPVDRALLTPLSWLKHVHPTIVANGAIGWAPNNLSYTTVGLYFSFGFMYYLRRYKTAWWERYNYVISAALGGGVAFAAMIIFFALQWDPVRLTWWGSSVVRGTIDGGAGQQSLLPLPEKGYFGPDSWY